MISHAKGFNMITGISRFTKGEFNQNALDEVWNKGRETFKDPETPPSSGFIPNSADLIWQDMTVNNTVFPAIMPSSYGQFSHPYMSPILRNTAWTSLSPWYEVESQGTGGSCSEDTNTTSNTYVEIGHGRTYALYNGAWQLVGQTAPNKHGGAQYPTGPDSWERSGCRGDAWSYILDIPWTVRGMSQEGRYTYYPKYGYRYHGWSNRYYNATPATGATRVEAFSYTVYMRLSMIDPNGIDDRQSARYVAHSGVDWWDLDDEGLMYDAGISRYRSITSDWAPVNYISGDMTEAELHANPPPFPTTP